ETVDGACASSLLVLEHAVDRLRQGRADAAVVGGVFLTQNLPFLLVFNRLQAVSKSGQIRPMDRRADGLLMGEGAGAVLLKRLDDAIADGDQIYAVVKGTGSSSDGKQLDVLAPAWKGQLRALERAYQMTGVDPASIGYLELHGTGTEAGDLAEATTVNAFFGTLDHPPSARAMGTVKSIVGHLMPASGMAALIRTTLALSNKILPPSLHCEQPRDEIVNAAFYINTHTRPWVQNDVRGPRRAGINSFGFGGVNVHAILEEVVAPTKRRSKVKPVKTRPIEHGINRPSELAMFSAKSVDDLATRLQDVAKFLDQDQQPHTAADIACSLAATVDFSDPVKLGLIYETLAELRSKINVIVLGLGQSEIKFADESLYFSTAADKHEGKIAFIFPGMGFPGLIGNYPDHLLELCLHYPELRAEFDFFEERDRHPDDHIPTSSVFVPPASLPEEYRAKLKHRLAPPKTDAEYMQEPQPEERYLAAMGVTLANWVSWTLLSRFDIPVDMATGQSQGEMAAVCAVGMGDFHDTAPAYWKVLNVNPRYGSGGRLAFVWATEEQVQPLLDQNPGTYIAIYMAPMAVILGGDKDGLVRVTDELRKLQCLTQILPYPPIHTPCLSHLHGDMEEALRGENFAVKKPKIKLYSSITTEPYPTDLEGVRQTLMLNLDHPLRVWQTIRRLYDDGARIFVQVGGGHMSAHMKELMPEGVKTVTAALDVDTRNPITQLQHLLAQLFTNGVPFKPAPLFDYRVTEVLDLSQPRSPLPGPKLMIPLRLEWSPLDHADVTVRDRKPKAEEGIAKSQASVVDTSAVGATEAAVAPSETTAPVEELVLSPAVVEFDAPYPILLNAHVVQFVEGQELKIERILEAETDRYLLDHLFVYCPTKDQRDCLPIVPMTMSLEFIAEAAALLCPGLGIIGYENIKAMRWIGLEDKYRALLHIEARTFAVDDATGERRVDVTISYDEKRAFSGRVVFGTAYRQDLHLEWPDVSDEPGWPIPVEELYAQRRMFHGPSFHVVTGLDRFSNPVCTGALRVLPKDRLFTGLPEPALLVDPCLLDGIGQFVGLWCQMHEWFILPTGVEKVEIYGPTPPVGTDCPIKCIVTQFDVELKQLRADFEIEDGQGNVWMRFVGWGDWVFKWTPEFLAFNRFPTIYLLASPLELPSLPGDAAVVQLEEHHLKGVDLMWVARTALTDDELAEFRALEGNKPQRRFLLSRMAAKDAVRQWLHRVTGEPLRHPAEYQIRHDEHGRPYVTGLPEGFVPELTVAHKADVAIAVACSSAVGIDLELADRDTRSLLDTFATADEIGLVDQLVLSAPEAGWETRLWCAKEASGKARGTGLNGYPKRLRLTEADDFGRMRVQDVETGAVCDVQTSLWNKYLVAVATPVSNGTEASGHNEG
ncbi:MAG TPA: beta-ketoacyl synthase N-terminal-like domain-containing protein, partial [Planctomycetaceae bacterium]|nr:beta-ketoacyl synthase N-terminal-like domain-containing protein [Planctomycetaceae bacterium]